MSNTLAQPNGIFSDAAFTRPHDGAKLSYPILIVGGSTAAYSATLGALNANSQVVVCLVQPKQVLGGQFTAQALPASDDGKELASPNGETYAISKTQRHFRQRQRELQPVNGQVVKNPGGGWVSPFSVTTVTAARALNEALEPFLAQKRLVLIPFAEPVQVMTGQTGQRRRVTGVVFRDVQQGGSFTVAGQIVIEATDLGDLLELGNIQSRVGQETRGETGEQKLPEQARPLCQQTITFGIMVERTAPTSTLSFNPPDGYDLESWLQSKDFTSTFWIRSQQELVPRDFYSSGSIFDYRRLQRGAADGIGDVAVISWSTSPRDEKDTTPRCCGNDYRMGVLVGVSREERQLHIQRARDRAAAYAYFLHSQVNGLKPRPDLSWTDDGIALEPYIREARRGVAVTTVRHEDVAQAFFSGNSRARSFDDSVGIGQYHYFDIHGNTALGQVSLAGDHLHALPFTIPLGALIPINTDGLVLSSKSIGTTHITNAAYRVHPVEWAIGEAGGHLAALAVSKGVDVRDVVTNEARRRQLQGQLARYGVPLFWFNDVATDDPDFEAIQVLAAAGIVRGDSNDLSFQPQGNVSRATVAATLVRLLGLPLVSPKTPTFVDVPAAHWAYAAIETLRAKGLISALNGQMFAPGQPMTQLQFSLIVQKLDAILPSVSALALAKLVVQNQNLYRRELSRVLYEVLRVKLGLKNFR